MNILFFTRRFYPDVGGVEKHIAKISEELIKLDHNITIISEVPQNKSQKIYQSFMSSASSGWKLKQPVKSGYFDISTGDKFRVFFINAGRDNWLKKFRIWLILFKNRSIISGADIVHCHDVFFWYIPFKFLYPFKKAYVTFHGYETKFPPTLKSKIVRKISEIMADGNICVGSFIEKWYGTKAGFITYGGVEASSKQKAYSTDYVSTPTFFTQNHKVRTFYKKRIKNPEILLFGRLEDDNAMKEYLDFFTKLNKLNIKYKLIVRGSGKYKKKFKRISEYREWESNMNRLIDRSTFVFASSYLSILEAINRGKIVFAIYNNTLKKDYLYMSPFKKYSVISSNANEMLEKFIMYCKNPLKCEILAKKGVIWSNKHTWHEVSKLYLKLWKI